MYECMYVVEVVVIACKANFEKNRCGVLLEGAMFALAVAAGLQNQKCCGYNAVHILLMMLMI